MTEEQCSDCCYLHPTAKRFLCEELAPYFKLHLRYDTLFLLVKVDLMLLMLLVGSSNGPKRCVLKNKRMMGCCWIKEVFKCIQQRQQWIELVRNICFFEIDWAKTDSLDGVWICNLLIVGSCLPTLFTTNSPRQNTSIYMHVPYLCRNLISFDFQSLL